LPSRLRGESSLLTIISLTGLRAFHQQATSSIQGGGVSFRPGTWHFPKVHGFSPHALPQEADTHYRNVASRRLKIRRIVPPYLGWVCWNEQSPNGEFSPSGRRAKFRHEPNLQSAVGFKSVMVGELLPVAVQSWNSRRPHSAYLCRPLGISANAALGHKSVKGHQRKEKCVSAASALPQTADITQRGRNVHLVPLTDIADEERARGVRRAVRLSAHHPAKLRGQRQKRPGRSSPRVFVPHVRRRKRP
jgi:hypothetical protein